MFKTGAMSCACTPANTDIGKVRSWHGADRKQGHKVRCERRLCENPDKKLK